MLQTESLEFSLIPFLSGLILSVDRKAKETGSVEEMHSLWKGTPVIISYSHTASHGVRAEGNAFTFP